MPDGTDRFSGSIGGEAAPTAGRPIGRAEVPGSAPISAIGSPASARGPAGASVEAPGAYFGGSPVGGPSSIFNIAGAPISVLGGVFGDGLPIGGPVTQIFRSGAPVPNTLYIITLTSGGPIGLFFLPAGGVPIGFPGLPATIGLPIGLGFGEAGTPIFATAPIPGIGVPIGKPSRGGLQL